MLSTVLQNFGSLTTMRILSRIIHFMLKTYLIRTQLDQEVLAHLLHLDLLLTTSLHVARSCFKPSYQKVENQDHVIKSSMNIMTFGVLATIGSTIVVSFMQHYQYVTSGKSLNNFTNAIILYSLASVCEAMAEKYMVECLIKFEYFKIGLIEVVSVIPKTIFIIIAVFLNWFSSVGILVFGASQLLYSLTMMTIFFVISSNKALFLQPIETKDEVIYFDPKSKAALKEFSLLSFLKLILQQFEQIVLVVKDSSHISSIFSLINNLGSIVVRYLFAPLNEIIFNHFSRGKEKQSIQALESFLKITIYFSVLIVGFGYNYAQVVLQFLYSQKWVSQESISALRTFMVLLIFLGLNGIIQAFLFAKGKDVIKKYNFYSVITTGVYLSCTVLFLQLGYGATGLFLGKIINMGSRILLCWYLGLRHHLNLLVLIKQSLPSPFFFVISTVLFILSHKSYGIALHVFQRNMFTLALGVFLFGLNLLPIFWQNRSYILQQVKKRWVKGKEE